MFKKKTILLAVIALLGMSSVAWAQFSGPTAQDTHTVAQMSSLRIGTYVTLTGNIIEHQKGNYYTFQDETGTIRVEIANNIWQDREISPDVTVRIAGELDRTFLGRRYVWVKSLAVLP